MVNKNTDPALIIEQNHLQNWLYWGRWPGLKVVEEPYLTWTLSDIPYPIFNNILAPNLPPNLVGHAVEDSQGRARVRKVSTCWRLGPSAQPAGLAEELLAAGFEHWFSEPGLSISLKELKAPDPLDLDLTFERISNELDLQQFCDIILPLYEYDEPASKAWYELLLEMGFRTQDPLHHYLAILEGKPVATTSVFEHRRFANLSYVGTRPEFQRRGIASRLVTHVLQDSIARGCHTSVLYASPEGAQMYRRLGFQDHGEMNLYTWSPEL